MATRGLDSQIWWGGGGGGGKIEGRHILIIALSEYHDYMNSAKGGHSVIMQGRGSGTFSSFSAWTCAWRQVLANSDFHC